MTLSLDKSTWKRVRLGDVVRRSREQVDPVAAGFERYVGGGHIDGDSLTIERWGSPGDGQMGSTFRYVFRPGQVLFVSARPYLRKTGIPQFGGVVADKTYVLDAVPENGLLHEFLPFVLSSDRFVEFATAEATGSMNPRLLWGTMQRFEFELPPAADQRRIADTLWRLEWHRRELEIISRDCEKAQACAVRARLAGVSSWASLGSQFEVQLGKMLSSASKPTVSEIGQPYLANINVRWNDFEVSELRHVVLDEREREKFRLEVGDILVCEGGEVGRAAVWDGRLAECYYQKALHRLRPKSDEAPPGKILVAHLRDLAMRNMLDAHTSGTTFSHLTREKLIGVSVPIVTDVEARQLTTLLHSFTELASAVNSENQALRSLNQAMLATIFGATRA